MRAPAPIILAGLAASFLSACATIPPAGPPREYASFDWFLYEGADPSDLTIRIALGQYRNPILKGFYPDPSITRVGDDYYLVNSTFAYFPGIPVFHSRDLVSWTQIGNAVDRPAQLDFGRIGMSRGVFAPLIAQHAGVAYLFHT